MPKILAEIVNNALKNISEREVLAADIRNELKQYEFEEPGGETQEFIVIRNYLKTISKMGMLRNSMATIMPKYH